jgi:hypothetical protein
MVLRRKGSSPEQERRTQNETLFVSADTRSMRRGRRVAPRTDVCRPCLVWRESTPEQMRQGVIMDLNPYGMRVRMLEPIEVGADIVVQMMRDEEFQVPLSPPIRVRVMRTAQSQEGFVDHGLKVRLLKIVPTRERRVEPTERPVLRRKTATRMYTIDYTVDEHGVRRTGRNRG